MISPAFARDRYFSSVRMALQSHGVADTPPKSVVERRITPIGWLPDETATNLSLN
jgi:hypothetical protein